MVMLEVVMLCLMEEWVREFNGGRMVMLQRW